VASKQKNIQEEVDLDTLEGCEFTAFTSASAYGCGGREECDAQDTKTTFIIGRALTEKERADLEEQWGLLWAGRFVAPSAERDELLTTLGVTPDSPPLPSPQWDKRWKGTREEFERACTAAQSLRRSYEEELTATLKEARLALFVHHGAVAVDAWIPSNYELTHDFGCHCSWRPGGENEGATVVLRVRAGVVYAVPSYTDIESALARADVAATKRSREVEAANQALIAAASPQDIADLCRVSVTDTSLTFDEWVAATEELRKSATAMIKRAVSQADWATLRKGKGRLARELRDTKHLYRYIYDDTLRTLDIGKLTTPEATEIGQALGLLPL
jgi:hypothetical protein